MGYYDVSLVVDGALDEDRELPSDDALEQYMDKVRVQARAQADDARTIRAAHDDEPNVWPNVPTWELYVLWHDHAPELECECVQYVQSHKPALVLRDGVEVDA